MQVELKVNGIDTQPDDYENLESLKGSPCSDTGTCFHTSKPVVKGSISCFPIKGPDNKIEQRRIEVVYIKLSINDELFNGFPTMDPLADDYRAARQYYGTDLVKYYLKKKMQEGRSGSPHVCDFPHHTTWDQNYEPEQFKAYVDLGYHIVRNEIESEWSPSVPSQMYAEVLW